MSRFSFLAAAIALLVLTAAVVPAQKARPRRGNDGGKAPEVEVMEIKVHRDERAITVDGRVRNKTAKPMRGLILFFELLESDGKMISRMIAEVTEDELGAGEETEFAVQTRDQVRAVHIRVDAEDKHGRYLTVDKPGPHAIE